MLEVTRTVTMEVTTVFRVSDESCIKSEKEVKSEVEGAIRSLGADACNVVSVQHFIVEEVEENEPDRR